MSGASLMFASCPAPVYDHSLGNVNAPTCNYQQEAGMNRFLLMEL